MAQADAPAALLALLGLVLDPGPRHRDHGAGGVELDAHLAGGGVPADDSAGRPGGNPDRVAARKGGPQAHAAARRDARRASGRRSASPAAPQLLP